MKIILLKDIKKQGKAGDILDVKDGYGTFLVNNKSAVVATQNSMSRLDRENEAKKLKEEENIKECEKLKEKLESITLIFKVKTGENDKVFGSISPKHIVEELKNKGFNIDKKQIKIDGIISTLGFHFVNVELHKKVIANLKIELRK